MLRSLKRVASDVSLLLARIVVGAVLILRAWQRWYYAGMGAQAEAVAASGLPSLGGALPWIVLLFELLGGTLLVFGFATRFVGLGLALLNAGIVFSKLGLGYYVHAGGFEYNLVLFAVGLLFLGSGCGRYGIDDLFFDRRHGNGPPRIERVKDYDTPEFFTESSQPRRGIEQE